MTPWREALIGTRPQAESYAAMIRGKAAVAGNHCRLGPIGLYPVKALGGISLNAAIVGAAGLETTDGRLGDRMAMIGVRGDADDLAAGVQFRRLSQREEPCLALALGGYEGWWLRYRGGGVESVTIDPLSFRAPRGETLVLQMFADGGGRCNVTIEGGPMTAFVRSLLAANGTGKIDPANVEVLIPAQGFRRAVEDRHRCGVDAVTLLSDGGQILLASSGTLNWMNQEIRRGDRGFEPLEMAAFRTNLVLNGLAPNAEDLVGELRIGSGNVRVLFGGLCVRCPVTQVIQATAERRPKEPLAWLAKNRPGRPPEGKGATFGINVVVPPECWGQTIRSGDMCIVRIEKQEV